MLHEVKFFAGYLVLLDEVSFYWVDLWQLYIVKSLIYYG